MDVQFSLLNIMLTESHFKLNADFKPSPRRPVEIPYGIDIKHQREGKTIKVTVSINSTERKNKPFMFDITMMGTFAFNKIPTKDHLTKIVRINCAAIIYPYIRESLADLTRRADITPFHLELINFVKLYKQD
jgi:preprotein translocase subunit SecB